MYLTAAKDLDGFARAVRPSLATGLVRVVAQLAFGAQTDETVAEAREWLRARRHWTMHDMVAWLQAQVAPRALVDKTPNYWRDLEALTDLFPNAFYLYVSRHPRAVCASRHRANMEERARQEEAGRPVPPLGPPAGIHNALETLYINCAESILRFAETLPPGRFMFVRGEDLLGAPDTYFPQICTWMEIDASPAAIEEMKHPERLVYAFPGPKGALGGFNRGFLENPTLRTGAIPEQSLDGPLDWVPEDAGIAFSPRLRAVAHRLGYR